MQKKLAQAQTLLKNKNAVPDKAIKILRALEKKGKSSLMLNHLMGIALLRKGMYKSAISYLHKAQSSDAIEPETFHLISVCYYNTGKFERALEFGNKAVELKKDYVEAWINIGDSYRAIADLDNAMKAFSEANKLDQTNPSIAYRIGSIYLEQGDLKKARELYTITIQMNPKYMEAYLGQSAIYLKIQDYKKAVEIIKEALKINPKNRIANIQLAIAYKDWGKYDEAIRLNEQLLQSKPKDGRLRINYALCLLEMGKFEEAEKHYLQALKDVPEASESLSNYLMGIHYNPRRTKDEIYKAHLLWDRHFAPKKRNKRPIPADISLNKKLKIGFISGGFRKHPVGWMITRALEHLPENQFEIYGYNTHSMYDSLSLRIKKICHKWTSVIGYTDEVIAKLIRDDQIDILVELSGHSAFNRLKTVALEPAPITVKWVGGLFNTSGMKSMDYLLTDYNESPFGEESYYTEKLVRLPNDYVCYEPPEYDIEVGKLPALYNGYITFGCFNNPSKINDELIKQWAHILHSVKGSKLLLKSKQYSTKRFVNHITELFSKYGIDKERLNFEGYAYHEDLLATYHKVDIALDPWPYSGGLTTCEALWMGVPVVTCAGPTFAGRHSVTHLNNTGNTDWVTENWEDYRSKVIELASNIDELESIRSKLRIKLVQSPLCDGARFGVHLSMAFREMWKQRVNGYANNLSEGEWQDHINIEPISDAKWNNLYEKNNTYIETAHISSYSELDTLSNLKLALPKSKENYTHYTLIERGNISKTFQQIVKHILSEGDCAIEIGAGYGGITVELANIVGEKGHILSLEPNPQIIPYLKETRRINKFHQVEIIEAAALDKTGYACLAIGSIEEHSEIRDDDALPISTLTIDSLIKDFDLKSLNFLLIDAVGGWQKIIAGASDLITRKKAVICIGNYDELQLQSINEALKYGYTFYEYIEEVGVLSVISPEQNSSTKWIFALTDEWEKLLTKKGFIFENKKVHIGPLEVNTYKTSNQPWENDFKSQWEFTPQNEAEVKYFEALNYLHIVNKNKEFSPSKKALLSVEAATLLLDLYSSNQQNISIICSLSRAFINIGKHKDAASILKNAFQLIFSSNIDLDISLPFVLPLEIQEKGVVQTNPKNWLKVKIAEAWLLLMRDSTYFLTDKDISLLKQLDGNPDALPIISTIAQELLPKGAITVYKPKVKTLSGKFVHIVFNHVYAQSLNDLLVHVNAHTKQEHYLFLEKHTAIENFYVDYSNNQKIEVFDKHNDLDKIKKLCDAQDIDAVFFHGLFFDWQKKLVKSIGLKKHIGWIMWGGDLYNPIKSNYPMRYLAGMIDSIHTSVEGDFKMFKDVYGDKESYMFGYPYAGLYGAFELETVKQDPPLIILGNSGDIENKHIEVLEVLANKKDIKDFKIVIPAAYNLINSYEGKIQEAIDSLGLRDNTIIQKDFIKPDEYIQLMTSASIFIGAHDRQQAVGNILGSIYGGNRTIIKKNISIHGEMKINPSWVLFQKLGFQIEDYDQFKYVETLKEIPTVNEDQLRKQQQIIRNDFGIQKRSDQLIDSCTKILNQIHNDRYKLIESL